MPKHLPKILVVDDQTKNLYAMRRLLEPLDVEVFEAISGQQALAAVLRQEFFLILMDVQMPEMDGFEAASLIFSHPNSAHIPIIFLTAINKNEKFALKGYETGAVDYMTKPVEPAILSAKVNVFKELWMMRATLEKSHKLLEQKEKEILKSRDDAHEANRSKSEFLANMSHEIRTPLNAIVGYTDMLIEEELSEGQREMMKIVQSSSVTLIELINDILDFSKIEAGEMALEEIPVDLEGLMFQVNEQSLTKTQGKDLELHVDIDDDVHTLLLSDPTRL